MSKERATKRRAKENFMSSDILGDKTTKKNIEGCSEKDATREDNEGYFSEQEVPSCSDDDDQPIVNTLPSSAAPTLKKKASTKNIMTYEDGRMKPS